MGKGIALKKGLLASKNEKILIFDGDFEIHPKEIRKLMILDKKKVRCVFGNRFSINTRKLVWDYGNLFFTKLFNFLNQSNLVDSLCCAKSFFKSDLDINKLKSHGFDIDIEIASALVKKYKSIKSINLNYNRRNKVEGKKLTTIDGFSILYRLVKSF